MNQNHKYQLATIKNGQWVYVQSFDSYEGLISFLVRNQEGTVDYREKSADWNNRYLNYINMNFNDTYSYSYWNGERYQKTTYTYEYMFIREDGAIIDVRLFYDDIIKKWYENSKKKHYYYSWRRQVKYEFRRGPVPFIRKRRGGHVRNIGYGRLIRMINHPDYQEYNRVSRYDELRDPWFDYPYKRTDKSWKSSYKCRKQWEKHVKYK